MKRRKNKGRIKRNWALQEEADTTTDPKFAHNPYQQQQQQKY